MALPIRGASFRCLTCPGIPTFPLAQCHLSQIQPPPRHFPKGKTSLSSSPSTPLEGGRKNGGVGGDFSRLVLSIIPYLAVDIDKRLFHSERVRLPVRFPVRHLRKLKLFRRRFMCVCVTVSVDPFLSRSLFLSSVKAWKQIVGQEVVWRNSRVWCKFIGEALYSAVVAKG